jgi:hypothetical protein
LVEGSGFHESANYFRGVGPQSRAGPAHRARHRRRPAGHLHDPHEQAGAGLGAYPLFLNTIPKDAATNSRPIQAVLLVAAVVLLVVVVLRWSATKGSDGKAQWPAVLLSAISFVIWVFVMGNDSNFAGLSVLTNSALGVPTELLSSLALFAWTAIAPVIYTGDRG